jgi:predicted ribosomally synthesized peptide with SipW-like signal peptide
MENKKVAAIVLLIAIVLSAFGIVYAHWSDTATINGEIHMGTLTLAFADYEDPTCDEYYHNPNPPPEWKAGEFEGKDVGFCNASYADYFQDAHTGKWGYETLVIEIDNAYPQYAVHTGFIVHNIGTVPLFFYGISLVGEKKNSTGDHIYNLIMNTSLIGGDIYGDIWEDVNNNGVVNPLVDINVINLIVKNLAFPVQIDPCLDEKMEIDLDFKQAAEMCHTYTLTFSLLAVQWNKLSEVYP